jgi:hypothetical protein
VTLAGLLLAAVPRSIVQLSDWVAMPTAFQTPVVARKLKSVHDEVAAGTPFDRMSAGVAAQTLTASVVFVVALFESR